MGRIEALQELEHFTTEPIQSAIADGIEFKALVELCREHALTRMSAADDLVALWGAYGYPEPAHTTTATTMGDIRVAVSQAVHKDTCLDAIVITALTYDQSALCVDCATSVMCGAQHPWHPRPELADMDLLGAFACMYSENAFQRRGYVIGLNASCEVCYTSLAHATAIIFYS